MCFGSTSDFDRRSSRLTAMAWQILLRLAQYDTQRDAAFHRTYAGGCYLIARAMEVLSEGKYRMRVVGLRKAGGILTPHVVCVSEEGVLVDPKNRYYNSSNLMGNHALLATSHPDGFWPSAGLKGQRGRELSDYAMNVTADDFTDELSSFGDSYRETFTDFKKRVEDTSHLSSQYDEIIGFVTA